MGTKDRKLLIFAAATAVNSVDLPEKVLGKRLLHRREKASGVEGQVPFRNPQKRNGIDTVYMGTCSFSTIYNTTLQ